jgi:hypothetical protein
MCRAAITDGNAFFPAATAICQSRQEHARHILQQTDIRSPDRTLAAVASGPRGGVGSRRPARAFPLSRKAGKFPRAAPGSCGGHAPLHAAARACLHAHVRCRHGRSWGRGRAACQVRAATRVESCTIAQTRFSRGRAGTCRGRGPLVDATEHHGVVHWSQDRGSRRRLERQLPDAAPGPLTSLYVVREGYVYMRTVLLQGSSGHLVRVCTTVTRENKTIVYKIWNIFRIFQNLLLRSLISTCLNVFDPGLICCLDRKGTYSTMPKYRTVASRILET